MIGLRTSAGLRKRCGITLLELILAVSLGLLLIGGIYSAIDQSARQTSIGKVEIERIQIARAVLRRIELDLRAAMFSAETAISDASNLGANSMEGTSEEAESEEGNNTGQENVGGLEDDQQMESTVIVSESDEESLWTGSLGIRGTASELWIDLSHVRRNVTFVTAAANAVSDLKTVTYFLSNSQQPGAGAVSSPIVLTDADGIGLARSEGDRSLLRSLNATGGVLPGTAQVLAPEINQLQFRYFDGLSWYPTWDSATSGALPRAVEIVIGFESPENRAGYMGNSAVSPSTRTFRLVVAIPVSDPVSEES